MSKSMLIIDTPESCAVCPALSVRSRCIFTGLENPGYISWRPHDCPLKPVPEGDSILESYEVPEEVIEEFAKRKNARHPDCPLVEAKSELTVTQDSYINNRVDYYTAAYVDNLKTEIARLTTERDAAIADIEYFVKICDTCKHGHLRRLPPWDADGNWQWGDCPGKDCSRNDHPNWQWRGIQKEAQC